MFSALAIVSALVAPDPHDLAYIARVYSKDPAVKTGYAVFVSKSDGTEVKRVTAAKEAADSVVWVGTGRIAWRSTAATGMGEMELWTSAAPFGRSSLVARSKAVRFGMAESFVPSSGRPLFELEGRPGLFTIDPKSGTLVAAKESKLAFRELTSDPELAGKPIVIKPPVETDWTLKLDKPTAPPEAEYVAEASRGDQVKPVEFTEHLARLIWQEEGGDVWFLGSTRDTTLGSRYSLRSFDWFGGGLTTWCEGAGEIDFWPGRPSFAYTSGQELTPWSSDGKRVWTNQLWVGDLVTGSKRRLFGDGIHFVSVALRGPLPEPVVGE